MSLYNNGNLDSIYNGIAPTYKEHLLHELGRCVAGIRYFDGTIAYIRFWHGEALDADQVAELYALRIDPTPAPTGMPTTASTILRDPDHEFDFRGCDEATVSARYIYIYLDSGEYINLLDVY